MLGYQAKVEDKDGNIVDETEVYNGGHYFMSTVQDMADGLEDGQKLVITREKETHTADSVKKFINSLF